jgi:Lrp/AsnC family transcriptional regulator for asnA, asnC and gidA
MLDEIDRAIIDYMQYDGRAPFTQIAEHLNISEGAVRRRVKNLTDSGLMQVVAIVEPHSLGLNEGVLIGINVQANMTQEVADAVSKLSEVSYLFQAAGEFDLFAEVFCKDRSHFVSFLNTKLQKIPGIERTQSFLILKMHKMSYRWGETDPPKFLQSQMPDATNDT